MSQREKWDLFVLAHLSRVGRYGLPDALSPEGDAMFAEWQSVFVERGIQPEDAEAASKRFVRLSQHPKPWDHLAVLLRLCGEVTRERKEEVARQARVMADEGDALAWGAWERLDEEARSPWLEMANRENPGLTRWPRVVERVAALMAWEQGGSGTDE